MFTSIDKALVALIMGIIFIVSSLGIAVPEFLNEKYVTTVVGFLTPFLVWFTPNRPNGNGTKAQMHPFTIIAAIGLFLFGGLAGCETIGGYDNVDTTRKAVLVADAEIRGANLLLQDLIRRGAIDTDSARDALTALRDAHSANQTALDAVSLAGDPVTAGSNLERANRALTVALTLLAQFTSASGAGGTP